MFYFCPGCRQGNTRGKPPVFVIISFIPLLILLSTTERHKREFFHAVSPVIGGRIISFITYVNSQWTKLSLTFHKRASAAVGHPPILHPRQCRIFGGRMVTWSFFFRLNPS
jgi:hypothetical protein